MNPTHDSIRDYYGTIMCSSAGASLCKPRPDTDIRLCSIGMECVKNLSTLLSPCGEGIGSIGMESAMLGHFCRLSIRYLHEGFIGDRGGSKYIVAFDFVVSNTVDNNI